MIRSSTATSADWRPVPKGFKVAWRNVDLAVFAHRSRLAVWLRAGGRKMAGLTTVARIGAIVGYMRLTDPARRAGRTISRALFPSKRTRRTPHAKLLKRRWNFVFQVTVHRDLGFELGRVSS